VGLFGWWPVPIGNQGGYDPKAQLLPRGLLLLAPNRGNNRTAVEFTWRGLELIVGNYYVLTLLVFIAATAWALVLTRRLRPERAVGPRLRCRMGGTPARRRPVGPSQRARPWQTGARLTPDGARPLGPVPVGRRTPAPGGQINRFVQINGG
jgi:hypothetical protein